MVSRSAGLAVEGLLAAARAELLEFESVWSVAAVLRRDVVAFLAHGARECDAGTDIGALACHHSPLLLIGFTGSSPALVARERLELSTLRL